MATASVDMCCDLNSTRPRFDYRDYRGNTTRCQNRYISAQVDFREYPFDLREAA